MIESVEAYVEICEKVASEAAARALGLDPSVGARSEAARAIASEAQDFDAFLKERRETAKNAFDLKFEEFGSLAMSLEGVARELRRARAGAKNRKTSARRAARAGRRREDAAPREPSVDYDAKIEEQTWLIAEFAKSYEELCELVAVLGALDSPLFADDELTAFLAPSAPNLDALQRFLGERARKNPAARLAATLNLALKIDVPNNCVFRDPDDQFERTPLNGYAIKLGTSPSELAFDYFVRKVKRGIAEREIERAKRVAERDFPDVAPVLAGLVDKARDLLISEGEIASGDQFFEFRFPADCRNGSARIAVLHYVRDMATSKPRASLTKEQCDRLAIKFVAYVENKPSADDDYDSRDDEPDVPRLDWELEEFDELESTDSDETFDSTQVLDADSLQKDCEMFFAFYADERAFADEFFPPAFARFETLARLLWFWGELEIGRLKAMAQSQVVDESAFLRDWTEQDRDDSSGYRPPFLDALFPNWRTYDSTALEAIEETQLFALRALRADVDERQIEELRERLKARREQRAWRVDSSARALAEAHERFVELWKDRARAKTREIKESLESGRAVGSRSSRFQLYSSNERDCEVGEPNLALRTHAVEALWLDADVERYKRATRRAVTALKKRLNPGLFPSNRFSTDWARRLLAMFEKLDYSVVKKYIALLARDLETRDDFGDRAASGDWEADR
ncbi:MAG: hypothetical protein IJM30_03850 [Thermoguttaceae bacterium]|nr:hypothetical protein [Thermoguttaceae bacterium]